MIHYGHLVLQNITIIIIFYQKVIIITRDRLEREREREREIISEKLNKILFCCVCMYKILFEWVNVFAW